MTYNPGVYAKGDLVKVAQTKAQAVALVFDGYKPQENAPVADATPAVSQEGEGTPEEPAAPKKAKQRRSDSTSD